MTGNATDTAAAPTQEVVSSESFFSDSPASSNQMILGAIADEPSADPILSGEAAADTSATQTPASTTDADPAAAGATDTPTDPAATTDTNTDGDDPWADVDLGDAPSGTSNSPILADEALTGLATQLGLEQVPATADDWQAAINNEIARQVAINSLDPIRQIDQMLGQSDRDLVRADVFDNRNRYDTDEALEARVEQLEEEGRLTSIATELRTELQNDRATHEQQHNAQLQQDRQAYQAAQRQVAEAAQALTDPFGKPMPDRLKSELTTYQTSRQYLEDLLNQDAAWHARQAARLHPKIGPVYRAQEDKLATLKGASTVVRELEHQTPTLGGGSALPSKSSVVGANDFFND